MSGDHVTPRLVQGTFDASSYMDEPPDLHIHCASETPPDFVGYSNHWLRIDDVDTAWWLNRRWQRKVMDAAHDAARVLAQGGTVLTTCYMGWNRSGLISALALVELGVPADEAIQAVRDARGSRALSNDTFVWFIRAAGREHSA